MTFMIIWHKNGNYSIKQHAMARDPHNDYYTAISWTFDRKYKSDSATFIFTLTNPHMTFNLISKRKEKGKI